MRFFQGTAAQRAASSKTGTAGDLAIETDTGNVAVADGSTLLGAVRRLLRIDEIVCRTTDYGDKADAQVAMNVSMTSDSGVIGGYSGFASTDVGKYMAVRGAGTSGAVLKTTVQSVTAGVATLAATASTTVAATDAVWGTPADAAIAACVADATASRKHAKIRFAGNPSLILTPVVLPASIAVAVEMPPNGRLIAGDVMSAMIEKPSGGYANGSRYNNLNLDGMLLAARCVDAQQGQGFRIRGGDWRNATAVVADFGRNGDQFYEMRWTGTQVTGCVTSPGRQPSQMTAVGQQFGSGTTDNFDSELIIKNCATYTIDNGAGNQHTRPHFYGYPLPGVAGADTRDFSATTAGVIVNGSNNTWSKPYADTLKSAFLINSSATNTSIEGTKYGAPSGWTYSGQIRLYDVRAANCSLRGGNVQLASTAAYTLVGLSLIDNTISDTIYVDHNYAAGPSQVTVWELRDGNTVFVGSMTNIRATGQIIRPRMNPFEISNVAAGDGYLYLWTGGGIPGRMKRILTPARYVTWLCDAAGDGMQFQDTNTKPVAFRGKTPAQTLHAATYSKVGETPAARGMRTLLAGLGLVDDSTTGFSLPSGSWVYPVSPSSTSTSNTLNDGNMRVAPALLPDITITRVAMEVTAAGSAGSAFRIVIYADNGNGQPGALVFDSAAAGNTGAIDGTVVGVQVVTLGSNLVLASGLYWIGAVLQGAPATQPTVRIANIPDMLGGLLISSGTATPSAAGNVVGYASGNGSVSSPTTPPSPFGSAPASTGSVARVIFKLG